ncbi:hypothetical protein SNOG_16066 [Parastagonospora nodorum SN15]|uniref:Uncharacterized protein n=1 Tax=Phaeosphaeria nodorum (strain SN15 / ATCC MYA-4574 / FGSC 10173) TaxID=321614 RepID=Q0TWY4_PHANO|nr:hypothetical protein SNOG_16066 [Parastagonospora nodorum SN15]KAH3939836.1 hypothetical protein HBH53_227020 [Parastagonospora nodorum]EAT76645.1 hypothetical protein SNOG_16066 [Parastagonospora nodorum SN15]KAH4013926.1 hypothetical protein HBI09_212900 [Parastagonospora nodorum]KAH4087819.1 hypothetical protein HBH46_199990 [Parastagonospora nodorum]KAH4153885.1 hypothetical protein HBH43_222420 [Parastagonospora nodorum]
MWFKQAIVNDLSPTVFISKGFMKLAKKEVEMVNATDFGANLALQKSFSLPAPKLTNHVVRSRIL